jgi:elongation factor G
VDVCNEWREKMVEAAAESSEELMNRYLENGELEREEIHSGFAYRTIAGEIHPMLCGTAFKNKGVQRMLDGVIDFLPSPVDIPPVTGLGENDEPVEPALRMTRSFRHWHSRLMSDKYVGQLTFIRVYSGVLKVG